jgi:O-antigen ligase
MVSMQASTSPIHDRYTRIAFCALGVFPLALILKRWIAEISVIVIGLTFLYQSYRARDWAWIKTPPMLIAFGLWLYILLVVTPLAMDPWLSLSRSIVWWRFPLFFAAVVFWMSNYTKDMKRITYWMLLIICAVTADALIQYYSGASLLTGQPKPETRLTGPLTKWVVGIYLAKLSFPILGLLLYEGWHELKNKDILLSSGLMTAILVVIALSNERTALMTYCAGLFTASALIYWRFPRARMNVVCFSILQIVLLIAVYKTQEIISNRVNDSVAQLDTFSATPYGQLWRASWEMFKMHPWFGVGLMNFREACPSLLNSGVVTYCDLHSHNVYLEWLSESGIFGFLGFAAFLLSLAWMIVSRFFYAKQEEVILIVFSAAAMMPTFFPLAATQSFFSNWPGMMAWFSMSLALGMIQRVKKPHAN